jgi:hypothetical protein
MVVEDEQAVAQELAAELREEIEHHRREQEA